MIGQKAIVNQFNSYDVKNFPQSNLLIGEYGCGKHHLVTMLCSKFNIECVDISHDISHEFLIDLYLNTTKTAYIIDINEIAKKSRHINKENALLKFIEEPPVNSFVFVLVEHDVQVIDTIKNRCVVWKFAPYIEKELREFKSFNDSRIYNVLNTPGKLLESSQEEHYVKAFELCESIINNLPKANVSNVLSLSRYLEEYKLIELLIILKNVLYNKLMDYDDKHFKAYQLVNECIEKTFVLNINELYLFCDLLIKLKTLYDTAGKIKTKY